MTLHWKVSTSGSTSSQDLARNFKRIYSYEYDRTDSLLTFHDFSANIAICTKQFAARKILSSKPNVQINLCPLSGTNYKYMCETWIYRQKTTTFHWKNAKIVEIHNLLKNQKILKNTLWVILSNEAPKRVIWEVLCLDKRFQRTNLISYPLNGKIDHYVQRLVKFQMNYSYNFRVLLVELNTFFSWYRIMW